MVLALRGFSLGHFGQFKGWVVSASIGGRVEMIHQIYDASRFSGHDLVHDSFSMSFDTARFTQV